MHGKMPSHYVILNSMLQQNDIIDFIAKNKQELTSKFHVEKIGIFGSFARNEQRDDSDIDFIVEFQEGTPHIFDLKQTLRSYLKNQFKRDIDLANSKYLKFYVKDLILKETHYVWS